MDKKMKIVLIIIMIAITSSAFVVAHIKEAKRENEPSHRNTLELDEEDLREYEERVRREQSYESLEVKAPGTFKSYMDGSLITDDTSEAYWQIRKMYPDENGIYSEGCYKGIAMAAYYGEVGEKFKITLSGGQVFLAVMTDTKQRSHINDNLADEVNGSIIEFVVDTDSLPEEVKISGSLDCIYKGQILNIEKII